MKKPLAFVLLLLSALLDAQTRTVSAKEFTALADSMGLVFKMPEGFKETVVKDNQDLSYDFAICDKDTVFEVRYTIWPLAPLWADYRKCKAEPGCMMVNPDNIYIGRAQANVINMTAGHSQNVSAFPTPAVKREFNADAGGSSFFELHCGFGKGYQYGQMVYLHRNGVADVIITYMSNDKSMHETLMNRSFHALKYK